MSRSHPRCADELHTCQKPSGRRCIEKGCDEPAGTNWGPLWCPRHDKERLERISAQLEALVSGD